MRELVSFSLDGLHGNPEVCRLTKMFEYLKSDLDKYTSFAQWKLIKNAENHSWEEGLSLRGRYSGFSGRKSQLTVVKPRPHCEIN